MGYVLPNKDDSDFGLGLNAVPEMLGAPCSAFCALAVHGWLCHALHPRATSMQGHKDLGIGINSPPNFVSVAPFHKHHTTPTPSTSLKNHSQSLSQLNHKHLTQSKWISLPSYPSTGRLQLRARSRPPHRSTRDRLRLVRGRIPE